VLQPDRGAVPLARVREQGALPRALVLRPERGTMARVPAGALEPARVPLAERGALIRIRKKGRRGQVPMQRQGGWGEPLVSAPPAVQNRTVEPAEQPGVPIHASSAHSRDGGPARMLDWMKGKGA
jgi:hypothetical protein